MLGTDYSSRGMLRAAQGYVATRLHYHAVAISSALDGVASGGL